MPIYSVLVRVPAASIQSSVGSESLYCRSGDGDDDEFGDNEFIGDVCWRLVVCLSFAKGMEYYVPLSVVVAVSGWVQCSFDYNHARSVHLLQTTEERWCIVGEMVVLVQIGVYVRGIFIWDADRRWWNLQHL